MQNNEILYVAVGNITRGIILSTVAEGVKTMKCLETNFAEDRYWVKTDYLKKKLSFLSYKQLNYNLEKLVDDGWLLKNVCNSTKLDRTGWYTISEKTIDYIRSNS